MVQNNSNPSQEAESVLGSLGFWGVPGMLSGFGHFWSHFLCKRIPKLRCCDCIMMVELNETLTDKFQESKQGVGETLIKHIFSDMLSSEMLSH